MSAPSGRKKRTDKPSPPDPPSHSGQKRPKRGPDPTSSTQRRPAESPLDPAPASAPPHRRRPHTGASASNDSAHELQTATTAFATLNVSAPVHPQGGPGPRYDEYGEIPHGPGWLHIPGEQYYTQQPEQARSYQNPTIPSPFSNNPRGDPYYAHQSEQARFYQNPINPSPYLNNPPATAMGTASAGPIDQRAQPSLRETSQRAGHEQGQQDSNWSPADDAELVRLKRSHMSFNDIARKLDKRASDCDNRWRELKAKNQNLKRKHHVPKAKNPDLNPGTPALNSNVDWSPREDEELVYLKELYDDKRDKWTPIAQGMYRAGFTSRTAGNYEKRWSVLKAKNPDLKRSVLKARKPDLKPGVPALNPGVDWSPQEDEELVHLKGQYDNKRDKWTLIAQGMYRAGFTSRTAGDCAKRWDKTLLRARATNFKPEDWSKDEDNRLTKLVKNFDGWDTRNGWQEISEQMRLAGSRRAPENCRTRWQETLRGPVNSGAWAKDEENFLLDFGSHHKMDVLIDLLERGYNSIRSEVQIRNKLSRLAHDGPAFTKKASQENTFDWSRDADLQLLAFNGGKKRVSHKAAADHLNHTFRTNIYTAFECERRWVKIKGQQRG